jgi:hypothetical protein
MYSPQSLHLPCHSQWILYHGVGDPVPEIKGKGVLEIGELRNKIEH